MESKAKELGRIHGKWLARLIVAAIKGIGFGIGVDMFSMCLDVLSSNVQYIEHYYEMFWFSSIAYTMGNMSSNVER